MILLSNTAVQIRWSSIVQHGTWCGLDGLPRKVKLTMKTKHIVKQAYDNPLAPVQYKHFHLPHDLANP